MAKVGEEKNRADNPDRPSFPPMGSVFPWPDLLGLLPLPTPTAYYYYLLLLLPPRSNYCSHFDKQCSGCFHLPAAAAAAADCVGGLFDLRFMLHISLYISIISLGYLIPNYTIH